MNLTPEERVEILERQLHDQGHVDPDTIDAHITAIEEATEDGTGPSTALGAKVVARAWNDPQFRARLLDDAVAAVAEYASQAVPLAVLADTEAVHHVIVCTLCSCYPSGLLGNPPAWYKSFEYRSRVVREPRAVLAEFGMELPEDMALHVHDSTAEQRYLVLPMRPAGTQGWSDERLAALVTRDSMVGTGWPLSH